MSYLTVNLRSATLMVGLLLLSLFSCFAFSERSARDVNTIIQNFRKEFKNTKTFTANFEQTTIVAGKKRIANGKIFFQKPNLLRQEFYDPSDPNSMTQLIVSDGKSIMSYTPSISQVTKQELSGKSSELFPGFGQSLEDLEKNYDISMLEDELAKKKGFCLLELKPKTDISGSGIKFDIMQVWINETDYIPIQFMYKDIANETTFIMTFKDVKLNEKIDSSLFKFKVPNNVQVITIPRNRR